MRLVFFALLALLVSQSGVASDFIVPVQLVNSAVGGRDSFKGVPARVIYEDGRSSRARLEIAVPGSDPIEYDVSDHLPHELNGEVAKTLYDYVTSKDDIALESEKGTHRGVYVKPTSAMGQKYAQYGISNIQIVIKRYGPDTQRLIQFFKTEEGKQMVEKLGYKAFEKVEKTLPKVLEVGIFAKTVQYTNAINENDVRIITVIGVERDISRTPNWSSFWSDYELRETTPLHSALFSGPNGTSVAVALRQMGMPFSTEDKVVFAPEIELVRAAEKLRSGESSAMIRMLYVNPMTLGFSSSAQHTSARDNHLLLEKEVLEQGIAHIPVQFEKQTNGDGRRLSAHAFRQFLDIQPPVIITATDLHRMGCSHLFEEKVP